MTTPRPRKIRIRNLGALGRKQLLAVRSYGTPAKLLNMLLCEVEMRAGAVKTRAMPYTAVVDVANACNLRCPGYPTGLGLKGRPGTFLDLEMLRSFLEQTADYLLIANLFNWGEPLLHPRVADEEICDAGLDHLVVSADGAAGASYAAYRRGGDFDLVLNNIRHVSAFRNRSGRKTPVIEWQILAFSHLEAEIAGAARLAQEVGADWFTVRGAVAPERLQPVDPDLRGKFYDGKQHCALLWRNITLQSDGGISPCCMIFNDHDDFGHIDRGTVRQVKNNERFQTARKLFAPGKTNPMDSTHPCLRCPVVHRQEHLRDFLAGHPELFADEGFQSLIADADDLKRVADAFAIPAGAGTRAVETDCSPDPVPPHRSIG